MRRFFICFDIISARRTASRICNSKGSSAEKAPQDFHSRSVREFESCKDLDRAFAESAALSKSLSGDNAVAPKVVAVRRRRLSRDTTIMEPGLREVAQSCSINSSAVICDGVKTSASVSIELRLTTDISEPEPS